MEVATAQSEVHRLRRVVLKGPRAAFRDDATVERQWRDLNYLAAPSLSRAIDEYERFVELLRGTGTEVVALPEDGSTTLDSIYVRDAAIVSDRGAVLCRMGKPQREGEPAAQEETLRRAGVPVLGRIEAPGRLEGGDVLWLDRETLVVGRGYRTNDEGVRQLHSLLGDAVKELIVVPLPHWRGPSDVMHLMSLISPVDEDLAVVYSPLLPVPFRERLRARGIELIEVPDEEFDSMGTNVLALAPRKCLMLRGNPHTRAGLERAGADVLEYDGQEISVKGAGGPTCLTRPLRRER
jgi:N-dimethylarginine dimethylaminohydrolase